MGENMENTIYDIIVLGGGPAGYTAALYGVRSGLKTLVIERFSAGGQMTETMEIENYPGFPEGIDGFSLGSKMQQAAERFGAKTVTAQVLEASLEGKIKKIHTDIGDFTSRTVIIATGARHRHLGLHHEEDLIGRGVGYCATCDGMLYRDKTVAVVGGGNSAASDALYLSKICQKVYLIHRRDTLRASKVYHQPLFNNEKIEIFFNTRVTELLSDQKLTAAVLSDGSTLPLDGIFISIGRAPETQLFKDRLSLDPMGYIIADETTKTSLAGVFAAGDVRTKPLRQIITAAADGATAATSAEEYLNRL